MNKYILSLFGLSIALWLLLDILHTFIATIQMGYIYLSSWVNFPNIVQTILGLLTLIIVISILVNILKSNEKVGLFLIIDGFWLILRLLVNFPMIYNSFYFTAIYSIIGIATLTVGISLHRGIIFIEY